MENMNNTNFYPKCSKFNVDKDAIDLRPTFLLDYSPQLYIVWLLILVFNGLSIGLPRIMEKLFPPTYSKMSWILFLPGLLLALIFVPLKASIVCFDNPTMMSIPTIQDFIQTIYDGMVVNLIFLNVDLIFALVLKHDTCSHYKFTLRFTQFFLWITICLVNFYFIKFKGKTHLDVDFYLTMFPSPIYLSVLSMGLEIINIGLFVALLVVLYIYQNSQQYKEAFFPLITLNALYTSFRFLPELIRFILHFKPTSYDYIFLTCFGFTEVLSLLIVPLIFLFNGLCIRPRRNEYERILF